MNKHSEPLWDLARDRGGASELCCAVTGEALTPGTWCRSVLVRADGIGSPAGATCVAQAEAVASGSSPFHRVDVSEAAWEAGRRPLAAHSHWRSRVPDPAAPRREPLDVPGLLELVQRLGDNPEDVDRARLSFRFVLALLLMRRRMLRFDRTAQMGGQSVWTFTPKEDAAKGPMGRWACSSGSFEVVDPGVSDTDATAVARQLQETLGVEVS